MDKFIERVINLLGSIGVDKYLHFIAGLVISSFSAIVLGMNACIVPTIACAFIKEFADERAYGSYDWADFAFTVCGGALIQLFCIL